MPQCPAKNGLAVLAFQCQQQQIVSKLGLRPLKRCNGLAEVSGDMRALRASRLRATNLGEVSSFSAFITLSIPSRTTASVVIWASTEKAFLFVNGSRSRLIFGQCIFNCRYSSPLFKCISVLLWIGNRRSYRLRIMEDCCCARSRE